MEANKKEKAVDVKCPYGYLIGKDFGKFPECDNIDIHDKDCHGEVYYLCKDMKSMCGEKSDFGSEIIAAKAARSNTRSYIKFVPYQCPYCDGWHIGRSYD